MTDKTEQKRLPLGIDCCRQHMNHISDTALKRTLKDYMTDPVVPLYFFRHFPLDGKSFDDSSEFVNDWLAAVMSQGGNFQRK